jgi:cytochrome c553
MNKMSMFLGLALVTFSIRAEDIPAWAFPGCPSVPSTAEQPRTLSVTGSTMHFTAQEIRDRTITRDWFPNVHDPMPKALSSSHGPALVACGYCHLADGSGRPENAKVSGLPVDYIIDQVRAIHTHQRHPVEDGWLPTKMMADAAASLSDEEIKTAASYYAKLKAHSFVRVVEAAKVPPYLNACFVLKKMPGAKQPLNAAIVEMPDAFERFEARDPHTRYTAYVPVGSIARGKTLVASGGGRTQPCSNCHGVDLKGNAALSSPPITGRFATYTFRQLLGFKTGARSGTAAVPMTAVVAGLEPSDFIDLAAYLASLKP